MDVGTTSATLYDNSFPYQERCVRHYSLGDIGNVRRTNSYPVRKNAKLPPLVAKFNSPKSAEVISTSSPTADVHFVTISSEGKSRCGIDPHIRVLQLERNLEFVKDHNRFILKCLHNEVEDLKRKNKELQFQLLMGETAAHNSNHAKTTLDSRVSKPVVKAPLPLEVREHISKLEREVKRLRYALGETLKMNATLRSQLNCLNNKRLGKNCNCEECPVNVRKSVVCTSPKADDFQKTFNEIGTYKVNIFKHITNGTLPRIK